MDDDQLSPQQAMDRAEPGQKCIRFRVDNWDTYRYAARIPQAVLQDTWAVYFPPEDVSHLVPSEALNERLRACESISVVAESGVDGFA